MVEAMSAATKLDRIGDFQKLPPVLASSPPSQNLKFEREEWSLFRTVEGLQQKAGVAKQAGLAYSCTVGRYPDGTVGEVFLNNHKSNSASDANAKDAAIVAGLALQHGVSLETIQRALLRDSHGRPTTPVGHALDIIVEQEAAEANAGAVR
jgi:hypothetical protein